MKYTIELIINKARSQVWQAFNDPEKMKIWQPALSEVKLLSGTEGQPGAESRLTFREKEREFSLTEKIVDCQPPASLSQIYENQFAINTVINSFIEQGPDQTLWITETEYKFKTPVMRLMGPLYKKNFTARTQRDMQRFKEMVENE
jgi:uncharacterized protein YndB with AHSA1/START domain